MKNELIIILKKYVTIFINEYKDYLTNSDLNKLNNLDYENIFVFEDMNIPFGDVFIDKIYLCNSNSELIKSFKAMSNNNNNKSSLNNKNLSSYFKYMCDNGYNLVDFYSDILMYFVFFLVIKNDSFLVKGFINQEMHLLSIKYNLKIASLYAKEEKIVDKLTHIFKFDTMRKIMFMDKASSFKYLCDNFGFSYAKMANDICNLVDSKYKKINSTTNSGIKGLIEYTNNYDNLYYGDVYNYILDFKAQKSL